MSDETQSQILPVREGDIVLYKLDEGPNKGHHRPAIVVRVWDYFAGTANLMVFPDGSNDGFRENVIWRTSISYSRQALTNAWVFTDDVKIAEPEA